MAEENCQNTEDNKRILPAVYIQTPDKDVLATGSLILPSTESYVEFLISNLKFRFTFLEDSEKGQRIEGGVIGEDEDKYYSIRCFNMKGAKQAFFIK